MFKETLCEHCVFKDMDSGKQVGCKISKLEKLKKRMENNYYVIEGFCSFCRNTYWFPNSTLEEKIDRVNKENKLIYDVVVVLDKVFLKEDLIKFLDSILALKYKPNNVIIIFDYSKENAYLTLEISKLYPKNFHFILCQLQDRYDKIYQNISYIKSTHICFTNLGGKVEEDIVEKFDNALNVEMSPMAMYTSENMFFCPTFLYKYFSRKENPFLEIEKICLKR